MVDVAGVGARVVDIAGVGARVVAGVRLRVVDVAGIGLKLLRWSWKLLGWTLTYSWIWWILMVISSVDDAGETGGVDSGIII